MSVYPIKAPASKERDAAKAAYLLANRKDRGCTPEQVISRQQDLWFHQVKDVIDFARSHEPGLRPEHLEALAELLTDEAELVETL